MADQSLTGSDTGLVGTRAGRRRWLGQAGAFARRHLRVTIRNKIAVALLIGYPVAWFVSTLWLFLDDPAAAAVTALGVGFGLFGALTATLAVFAGAFARDLQRDRYAKFRALPHAPSADLAGRFAAGTVVGSTSYLVTLAAAAAAGGTFNGWASPAVLGLVSLTLLSFCLIATSLAILIGAALPKPEYMTVLSIVAALIAFYLTGQNGMVPWMIVGDGQYVNWLPNSLATRLQVVGWVEASGEGTDFLTPPKAPSLVQHGGILIGEMVLLAGAAFGVVRSVAYGGD
ncbi:ABC transporter permease [Halobaculum sp. MBLA0147]|uniref:ABC transporter permease n=1 Tax=Halobaculum sp. MBLA0147 TaxID=3079934 RepID=UPI00352399EF